MKKTLTILFALTGISCYALPIVASAPIKPMAKVFNIKCDKSTDGLIVKKTDLNLPSMICSTKQGGWISGESMLNKMKEKNGTCMQHWEQMKSQHDKLIDAIKSNDANKVGTMVIKMHNEQESFIEENPNCSFKHLKNNSSIAK